MGKDLSKKIFMLVAAALITASLIPTHGIALTEEAGSAQKIQGQVVTPKAVEEKEEDKAKAVEKKEEAKDKAKAEEEKQNENATSTKSDPAEKDFEFDAATGTITAYKGAGGAVVVPETIGGVKVKAFGFDKDNIFASVFTGNKKITSIKLPSGITSISLYEFAGCTSLKSVTMSNNVTFIGPHAFEDTAIETINVPSSVTSFGEDSRTLFYNSKSIKRINVDSGNKKYCSIDGVLYNKDKTELIRYPEGKAGNKFDIPDTVKIINSSAFRGCTDLEFITIPEGVTKIGSSFTGCTSLTSLVMPRTLTEFTNSSLVFDCPSFKSIYFKGNAPKVMANFDFTNDISHRVNVYYDENATGFTTPEWLGHPSQPINFDPSDDEDSNYTAYETPSGDNLIIDQPLKKERDKAQKKILDKLGVKSPAQGQAIFHYDIKLLNKDTGEAYTKDNFPEEGVDITIPFPKNMDKNSHNYRVFHFPQGVDGEITEVTPLTITDDGIQFHVNGLSPFSLVAEKKGNTSYDTSPKTGDKGDIYYIFGIMSASFVALSVIIAVQKLRTEK